MKKTVKMITALLMVFCAAFGCAAAAVCINDVYPESEHNYQNNINQKWHYEYSEKAEGLYVTFSSETSFEKPTFKYQAIISGPNGEVIGGGVMKETKKGDKLTVAAKDYTFTATGKELSGKTLYIPDNIFTLTLEADESVTDYGFSIDRISDTAPENVAVITYECCDSCGMRKKLCFVPGEEIKVLDGYYCNLDDTAFVSWVDENGKEYNIGDSLGFASVNLKARRVSTLLNNDEVWNFSNSDPYFDPDYNGGYFLTKEDYRMMKRNIYKVFGIGVLPAVGLSIALSTYPDWYWNGSCYGMSTVVFLQHYNQLDILSGRNERSISQLKNDDDIISKINYYQWSAAGSFLCENFALNKDSKMYSRQLRELYESVESGNIVLFTYYSGEIFKTSGHTVLLTGAYTQEDGTNVLIAYDCNSPEDYINKEYGTRFYINKDFTALQRAYDYPVKYYIDVGAFNWTDDYTHFDAFNINGKGKVSSWYSHYFSQMFRLIKTSVSLINF